MDNNLRDSQYDIEQMHREIDSLQGAGIIPLETVMSILRRASDICSRLENWLREKGRIGS
ncbi:MAG: hypothetical protein APR55_08155 [Methanolinea sp. SDB]|nr:MAG: hypothetical protein APR55_08155 [Methanolinea sp. SDB]